MIKYSSEEYDEKALRSANGGDREQALIWATLAQAAATRELAITMDQIDDRLRTMDFNITSELGRK